MHAHICRRRRSGGTWLISIGFQLIRRGRRRLGYARRCHGRIRRGDAGLTSIKRSRATARKKDAAASLRAAVLERALAATPARDGDIGHRLPAYCRLCSTRYRRRSDEADRRVWGRRHGHEAVSAAPAHSSAPLPRTYARLRTERIGLRAPRHVYGGHRFARTNCRRRRTIRTRGRRGDICDKVGQVGSLVRRAATRRFCRVLRRRRSGSCIVSGRGKRGQNTVRRAHDPAEAVLADHF